MIATTLGLALAGYLAGTVYALVFLIRNQPEQADRAIVPVAAGLAFHTVSLGAVCVTYGGWPVGAPSESFSFISWSIVLFTVLVVRLYGVPALLSFALPLASLTTLLAMILSGDPRALAPLQAVPRGAWLWIHIVVSLLAVAALFLSAAGGVLYLLQERQVKSRRPGYLFARLPPLDVCDRLGYRSLTIGFALLTVGVLSGVAGLWSAPGLFWIWDPTRVLAIASWTLCLVVIGWRRAVGVRGRKAAWLTIAGSLSVTGILISVLFLSGRFHPFG